MAKYENVAQYLLEHNIELFEQMTTAQKMMQASRGRIDVAKKAAMAAKKAAMAKKAGSAWNMAKKAGSIDKVKRAASMFKREDIQETLEEQSFGGSLDKSMGGDKQKLMSALKLPLTKLKKDRHVDEASIKDLTMLIGKKNVDKSMKDLDVTYKEALKIGKLIPDKSAKKIVRGFRASRRSWVIFKYDFAVFQLMHAVQSKFGHRYFLVIRSVWSKEPGESEYNYAGNNMILFDR
jgi:hypothetical protein